MKRPVRVLATLAALSLLAGCGTRMSHTDVVAGVDEQTVKLAPSSLDALKQAAAARVAVAAPVAGAPAASTPTSPAPGPTGAAGAGPTKANPTAAKSGPAKTAPLVAAAPASQACTKALDPVSIGQVGTFSGVAGSITGPARTSLAIWARDLNTRGGLACHPVQVYATDDGGDSGRAASAEHDMVHQHHVVAFVGTILPLSIGGFRPAAEADKVPVIGGSAVSDDFYESPWFFPASASIDAQAIGLIRNGVGRGMKRLGLLYCVEATPCTMLAKKGKEYAADAGADLVYDAPVSITQPDFTAQCANAKNAKVDLLAAAMDGASITRLVRSCQAIGYKPLIATGGGLLDAAQSQDAVLRSFGVVTVSGEAPWFLTDQPGLKAYRTALTTFAPDMPTDGASVVAWTAGELLRAAIEHVAAEAHASPITTTMVLRGLGMIKHETLGGLIPPITFTPNQAHATSNGCIFFEQLTTSGWSAPQGSKPACAR
ncbi:MAG TPA: ABC transporter substrate-binding protein [Sporichthyaceae bacterium]